MSPRLEINQRVEFDLAAYSFRRGRVVRNGELETRKGIRRCPRGACTYRRAITVPAGHVYLSGDNRWSSDDSRFWGALPVSQVLGRYLRTAGTCGC
jgi:type IV secretory pathway protease TraF